MIHRTHQIDQLLMNDPDDLFLRTQRFQDLFANRLFRRPLNKILDDIVRNVSFQQSRADLLHAVADVAFRDLSGSPESRKGLSQTLCDVFEHDEIKILNTKDEAGTAEVEESVSGANPLISWTCIAQLANGQRAVRSARRTSRKNRNVDDIASETR